MSEQTTLLNQIKKVAYLEGDFVTRAGKKTNYYIDKYLFETNPSILAELANALYQILPPANTYDRIAAPELGAVPIAALLSVKVNKPFIIIKKQTKDYGTQKLIEGQYSKKEKVIVIEDILTTGGAVLRACEILNKEQIEIVEIIGVISRQEGAEENITNKGYKVKSLFTKDQLQAI